MYHSLFIRCTGLTVISTDGFCFLCFLSLQAHESRCISHSSSVTAIPTVHGDLSDAAIEKY